MKFTIHGVRGSVPIPKEGFLRYGGNTSCYEIETEQHQFFCDAGTGFLSAELLRDKKDVFVFFTHFHHDHIQGFPFNAGVFSTGKKIVVSSGLLDKNEILSTMKNYFSGPYFPINVFDDLEHLVVQSLKETTDYLKNETTINYIKLNHPGGAVGYSFKNKNKKVVILLDNEFCSSQEEDLLEFCKDADLMVWDGMFTEEELKSKAGWGHSSLEQGVEFFSDINCGQIIISHHAPYRTDAELDLIGNSLPNGIQLAKDGQVLKL